MVNNESSEVTLAEALIPVTNNLSQPTITVSCGESEVIGEKVILMAKWTRKMLVTSTYSTMKSKRNCSFTGLRSVTSSNANNSLCLRMFGIQTSSLTNVKFVTRKMLNYRKQ